MSEVTTTSVILGRSKIRHRILALIMDAPDRRMHLRAIARAVGTSAGTAARELGRLEDASLVRRTREGNQVYFEARNFDLKAVNPNAKSTEDTRTPEELLDIIESKGREVDAAIASLRELLKGN